MISEKNFVEITAEKNLDTVYRKLYCNDCAQNLWKL